MAKRGVALSNSSMAKCMVTPPSLNRENSYSTWSNRTNDATTALTSVARRAASPHGQAGMMTSSPLPTPAEHPEHERRTSWEDCRLQRDGYISFPDFDSVYAENETRSAT